MNTKNVYKFGICLLSALALSVSAQDFRGKDLNTSFRDKRIDNYQFQKARAIKGVTDFQRSAGESPDFEGASLPGVSFRNAVISKANFESANLQGAIISGADIRSASFEGANLEGADLYRATLLDSKFPKARKKITTRKESGGSGIGLYTAFEILKRYKASFILDETIDNDIFVKKIWI